jgi:hypothetical protein
MSSHILNNPSKNMEFKFRSFLSVYHLSKRGKNIQDFERTHLLPSHSTSAEFLPTSNSFEYRSQQSSYADSPRISCVILS